jgi:hypothetical protein
MTRRRTVYPVVGERAAGNREDGERGEGGLERDHGDVIEVGGGDGGEMEVV